MNPELVIAIVYGIMTVVFFFRGLYNNKTKPGPKLEDFGMNPIYTCAVMAVFWPIVFPISLVIKGLRLVVKE